METRFFNANDQRLQQFHNFQKNFDIQSQTQRKSMEQEWLMMNMLNSTKMSQQQSMQNYNINNNNNNNRQFMDTENGPSSINDLIANQNMYNPHPSPISPDPNWLMAMSKLPTHIPSSQFDEQNHHQIQHHQQKHHQQSLSPQSTSSSSNAPTSNQWMINIHQNMANKNPYSLTQQQQVILNNLTNLQPGFLTGTSPLETVNHLQHSRSQTPSVNNLISNQSGLFNKNQMLNLQKNDSNPVTIGTNLQNMPSIGSGGSSSSSGNGTIPNMINNLDEYLPYSANPNLAQNLTHLTKLIAPQANLNELTLNNLNELALSAGLNSGVNGYTDAHSNSSQSPPISAPNPIGTIGSNLTTSIVAASNLNNQSTFSGNGNLNPPVRQNLKMSNMQIRTKFGTLGSGKSQFNSPHGFCLGIDEEIIIADTNNHRIQIFDKNGDFKYSFGSPGREEGQLWYPRKVTVMRDTGKFVVCDRGNERSRMQIFNKNGHFMKKISIRYIDIVAGLAIANNGDIVAVDSVSPTVFRIREDGELIKWFDCSDFMREPSDIAINGNEYYVCDFKGHCVVVFNEEGHFVRRIGGENITNFPNGIDVSDAGDVLVGDSHGNRFHVAVFSRDGSMVSEFECPYVKVSRCCGLKITSEGYVVTLAKNNHHVLVLNTLYVS